jgi:outer membrane protein
MSPVVIATYQARGCSVLLTGSVVTGNPQMDITDQVVTGLNAKIKTLTFNRERLDAPAPAAPAAPAPAAAAKR